MNHIAKELLGLAKMIAAEPKLYKLIEDFSGFSSQLGCGATDTEPRNVFYDLMIDALVGKPWKTPSPEGWQIYRDKGVAVWKKNAAALSSEAKKAAKIISNATNEEKKALADYMGWTNEVRLKMP